MQAEGRWAPASAMHLDAAAPVMMNASRFHNIRLNAECVVYSSSVKDSVPIASFEDAANPAIWRGLYHPFAHVVVNTATGECVLVRDHLGLRPLYYWWQSGRLIFGDTIPDILRHLPNAANLLDSEVVDLFADIKYYTDNTIYAGVRRVEPGHIVHCKPDGRMVKSAFWRLEQEGNTLRYRDEREYLEHFSSLMLESVQNATRGVPLLAAEFSAGMDSTAVYGACAQLGLNPALFMHGAPAESSYALTYNSHYERAFEARYPSAAIHRIMAENFDPVRVFQEYASWFGGPSPYIFELFAHNLHRAVSATGHTILLSGFGGDQGVSGHIPTRLILPALISGKKFRQAWAESAPLDKMRRFLLLAQCAHPSLHKLMWRARDLKSGIGNALKGPNQKPDAGANPYRRHYFKTVREAEWSFLQGPDSHEIRMRIEYSSVVAKKMGFEYRYPLLFPKLLEFFLSLPIEQKRRHGVGRYLMRRYLAQLMPSAPFNAYHKKEGLDIMPATMDAFKAQWAKGVFQDAFESLPFAALTQDPTPHRAMIKTVKAFMLNECSRYVH